MISEGMASALNDQINAELYSAYLYMAMSAYTASEGLAGAANWFRVQAQEEMAHVDKFAEYIQDQDRRVILMAIDEPPADYEGLGGALRLTLEHERKVTARVSALVEKAVEEHDRASEIFLQWFVSEQVEEEKSAKDLIDKLKLAGEAGPGMFMLDAALAARVYTPPAN